MADNEFFGSDDAKIIKMILANKDEAERHIKNNFSEDWLEYYNNYRNISKGKPYDWMSDEFLPMTHSHVETALSNILQVIFSVTPPVQIKPREKGDNESAKVMEQLIAYDFQVSGFYMKFLEFVKTLLMYGTAVGKVTWKYVDYKRKFKARMTSPMLQIGGFDIGVKETGWGSEERVVVEYDDPIFENCNLNDIFVDPQSINIQDSWVIHRVYRDKNHLKAMQKQGVYSDEVVKVINEIEKSDESNPGMKDIKDSIGMNEKPDVTRAKGAERVELLEWWGDYDLEGNGNVVPCVFTLAANKYLIRKVENPFWHGKKPFVKGVYIPMPNEFHGIGIPEILYGIQNTINETVNQRIDNITFVLNRMYIVKNQSGIDKNKIMSKPGALLSADEKDAIVPVVTPDVTVSAYRETAELERWAQEADAVSKITMGTVGAGTADTLGGMQIQQATAGNRFMMYNKIIENMAFVEIVKMFYELNHQYIDKEKAIRVVGEMGVNYATVAPEDVVKEYDFIPAGVLSMDNRNEKALKLIQFLSVSKGDNAVKVPEIMKKILQYLGFPDTTEFIRTPEEMQAEMMKQMMIQQVQAEQNAQMNTRESVKKAVANKAIGAMVDKRPTNAMVGGEVVQPPGVAPVGPPTAPNEQVGV